MNDRFQYDAIVDDALRGVVRRVLRQVAEKGLPGSHHFYISFRSTDPGVRLPEYLKAKYPEEMTIVLQHQYWDLAPGETFFSVTLQFGGQPKRLSVPYAAVTRFYDPSVQFLLQFEPPAAEPKPAEPEAQDQPPAAPDAGGEAKVVSLDQFRKK